MRQSLLFQKTTRHAGKHEISKNAELLTRAGYIKQLMAGVYTYLPPGLKVLNNIENIIRDEMNAIGGQEILMPALQPREVWDTTKRWDTMDVLFKLKGADNRDLALGPTHEEVVSPLAAGLINSYRDMPMAVYQVQTKFRNEPRAKSGLLRGREFRMKDMYSFHASQDDLDTFYQTVTGAYHRIFERCGLGSITRLTYASGGAFSKYSHEFQTLNAHGEDTVYLVPGGDIAINKEIIADKEALAEIIPGYTEGMEAEFEIAKSIEVGNIFKLGTRFSEACGVKYAARDGSDQVPVMGCYGLGPSRIMGTIAECLSHKNGLVWPRAIAPYSTHLLCLSNNADVLEQCDQLYETLLAKGISVLYDDRINVSAGVKLNDSRLLGLPDRIIFKAESIADNYVQLESYDHEPVRVAMDKIVEALKHEGHN